MNQKLNSDLLRLKTIADLGLMYCNNEFDKERYEELKEISLHLLSNYNAAEFDLLKENLPVEKDYPTVKVDIRGLLLSPDNKILMVKEMADGKWSLPGGWADIGFSPKENIIKEMKEETGLDVTAENLLAVFDKHKHNHPPELFYVYKMVFYCKSISAELKKGFDVLDVAYFPVNELPGLSENRILKEQIELLYQKAVSNDFTTCFD